MKAIKKPVYAIASIALAAMLATGCTTDSATAPADKPSADGKGFYALVNDMQLYYEIHGTGQPLVLLHGGLSTIDSTFGALLPELTENRRVIAIELQAHGHTADIDRPLSYELMADDVAGLINHLGLENTDILGYSLGGGVALQIAARNPDLVDQLVVTSAPYRHDGWTPETLTGMASMDPDALIGSPMHEIYRQSAPNPADWPALVTKVGQLLTEGYDWTEQVAAIKAPTLVVIAESDSVQRPHAAEMVNLLNVGEAANTSTARLEIVPATTHYDIMSRADLLLPIITPFLDTP